MSSEEMPKLAREMLKLAEAAGGTLQIPSADQTGDWVRVGSKDFRDDKDPAVAAHGRDALKWLVNHEYVEHLGGAGYRLTGKGWDAARSPYIQGG